MKKTRLYIIGTQKMAEMVVDIARRHGYSVAGFFDDVTQEKTCLGKPIFGPVAFGLTKKFIGRGAFIVAVGDNNGRKKLLTVLRKNNATIANLIDPQAVIMPSATLGKGNIVFPLSFVGSKCQIGSGNIVFPGVTITHHTIIGDNNFFAPGVSVGGGATIGNLTKIGMNSVIAPSVRVKDGFSCPPLTMKRK